MKLIVYQEGNQRDKDLNYFINYKINGLKTITKVEWSERILQRVPSNIITDRDLIKWDLISPSSSIQNRIKRLADIILSLIILVLTIPFVVLALIIIKIEDRGPLLYKQKGVVIKEKYLKYINCEQ